MEASVVAVPKDGDRSFHCACGVNHRRIHHTGPVGRISSNFGELEDETCHVTGTGNSLSQNRPFNPTTKCIRSRPTFQRWLRIWG